MKYSAKLVYKNYMVYFYNIVLSKKIGMIYIGGAILVNCIYLLLICFNYLDQASNMVIFPLLRVIFLGFNIFSFLVVCIPFIVWKQVFEIIDGKVIDYFPRLKVLDFKDLKMIVLTSKNQAYLTFTPPNSTFSHSIYWFGNNINDWINFINLIKRYKSNIELSIYYQTKGLQPKLLSSTPEDCYLKISNS